MGPSLICTVSQCAGPSRFAACGSANHRTVSKVSWRSKLQLLLCYTSASRAGSNLQATGRGWWRPGTGMAKALRAHEHTPRMSGPPEFRQTPASSRPSSRHALRSLRTPPRTRARTPRHAPEPRCRTSRRSSLPIVIESERLCGPISCPFFRRLLPARATKSHQTVATAETGRTACGQRGRSSKVCCALINFAGRSRGARRARAQSAQGGCARAACACTVLAHAPTCSCSLGSARVPVSERHGYLPLNLLGPLPLGTQLRTLLPGRLPVYEPCRPRRQPSSVLCVR
jgi:hypothetical protein